jgi:hypothetical protein
VPASTSHTSPNGASPSPPAFTGYSLWFKVLATVVLTLAAGGFVLAYLVMDDAENDTGISRTGGTEAFVEQLLPPEDSQAVQQSMVGIDLAAGWEGTLVVDGREIPPDQLTVRSAINRVEFMPGEGKVFTQLPSGRLCLRAIVWEIRLGRAEGARNVSWCIEVV